MIKIGPGEHHVSLIPRTIIVTVLGSCVAACIRDPVVGVGGMNHFMLPESETGSWGGVSANMRYGNFAMEELINELLRAGALRSRLEVKLFGGARMTVGRSTIGPQNADFVEAYLMAERIPIAASHLRGDHARRIEYAPVEGTARMLEMALERSDVISRETNFRSAVRSFEGGGSIELFDSEA